MSRSRTLLAVIVTVALCGGCQAPDLLPYTVADEPMVLLPVALAGITDQRGRFRDIFCAVLQARPELPDHRSCDVALTRVGAEPPGTGRPVPLGRSNAGLVLAIVPGVGYRCFAEWLELPGTVRDHLGRFGYGLVEVDTVEALSSSTRNAALVRDWVIGWAAAHPGSRLVLLGYSKGAPDVLEALVEYPEILPHVAAVVSAGGSIGGSPLANDATQNQLELLTHWPGSECDAGDGGGLESLKPSVRRSWLATHPLPAETPYYSVVNHPDPDRVSSVLKSSYRKLARIDGRNDTQVLLYDQIIPRSTLVAFLNADHWALAVPIARSHRTLGKIAVDRNDYPREGLFEALLRFIEEDLGARDSAR